MLISLPVYRETGRKVRFIVAAKSMKHRYIGFFGRMLASSKSLTHEITDVTHSFTLL